MDADSGRKQVSAASSSALLAQPVRQSLEVPNGAWNLDITPVGGWRNPQRLGLGMAAGIAVREATRKAGGTDNEKLIAAMEGMTLDYPKGTMAFGKGEHQEMQPQ